MARVRIGIDIMGGDFAPEATIDGSVLALPHLADKVDLVLIGDESLIKSKLQKHNLQEDTFEIVHAPENIEMGEHPTKALVKKPNSSIAVGFHLLKKGKIDGFASAGNTGAMFVGGYMSVKPIPGILRPCISSVLPKLDGGVNVILDVGANADCKADVLYQFGILGSLFAEHVCGITSPRVGLLNIGEEETKGNMLTIAAHELMSDSRDFNFCGNIESRHLFDDKCDVIVCDGFSGNVILKQAESIYNLIEKRNIKDEYFNRFNYENYGGTPILGLNKTVVIGHGISNKIAIKNMIVLTADVVEADLTTKILNNFNND
ncbi:MAG: phosphate acyltransferase PlsX [Flavobacteriales bacterium]|jgi:glycerol-3-phosphate acyltransferase PlsX|nr:phosphate acyltransferase PlsX [Flavobacteriales bacterium]MDG1189679.1 phosphate acyltransferase PlsX [Flavobacteriales bacterium]|tara:strand:- start:2952 stop:3905 length:954 start_codon:yes stop_codon:yes gene_type:complete